MVSPGIGFCCPLPLLLVFLAMAVSQRDAATPRTVLTPCVWLAVCFTPHFATHVPYPFLVSHPLGGSIDIFGIDHKVIVSMISIGQ